jgi:hypothetical protein
MGGAVRSVWFQPARRSYRFAGFVADVVCAMEPEMMVMKVLCNIDLAHVVFAACRFRRCVYF